MRTDSPHLADGFDDPPTTDRPAPTRSRVAKAVPIAMGGLVLGTGAALAALAWWLIPPYLLLMGFLLFEPAGRRVSATNPAGPEPSESGEPSPDPRGPVDGAGPDDGADPSGDAPSGDAQNAATASKARRAARSRGKKPRTASEPAPATWLQVAPGKFVRIEPGESLAGDGPHPPRCADATASAPAEDGSTSPPDPPGRPLADPGHPAFPTEDAIDSPHPHDPTPPGGLEPSGPRDLDDADADLDRDDASLASSRGFDPGRADAREPDAIEDGDVLLADGRDGSPDADDADDPDDAGADGPQAESGPSFADARVLPLADEPRPPDPGPDPTAEPSEDAPDADEADGALLIAEAAYEGPEVTDATDRPDADGADPAPSVAGSIVEVEDDLPCDEAGRPLPPVAERGRVAGRIPPASGTSRPPGGPASRATRGLPPSRRDVRSPLAGRLPAGFRRRSKRGDGRRHHVTRAFPPRSPPRRATVRA